jgi:hypothetical protein
MAQELLETSRRRVSGGGFCMARSRFGLTPIQLGLFPSLAYVAGLEFHHRLLGRRGILLKQVWGRVGVDFGGL